MHAQILIGAAVGLQAGVVVAIEAGVGVGVGAGVGVGVGVEARAWWGHNSISALQISSVSVTPY